MKPITLQQATPPHEIRPCLLSLLPIGPIFYLFIIIIIYYYYYKFALPIIFSKMQNLNIKCTKTRCLITRLITKCAVRSL